MSDLPPDQISADELRALEVLQRFKQNAECCGHQFAAQMISPSGTRYLVATDEPDNIEAWIFEQEDRPTSSDPTDLASPLSRSRVVLLFLKIRQILSSLQDSSCFCRSSSGGDDLMQPGESIEQAR
jgi:hypothetical protein